jgi:hypothetical protein
MVMNAIRLAGVTPTGAGYRIAPHFPFRRFWLRLPGVGVAADPGGLRGYVRPAQAGPIELRVRLPADVAPGGLRAWAHGRRVAHRRDGRFVVFRLQAEGGAAADWAVTWQRGSAGTRY